MEIEPAFKNHKAIVLASNKNIYYADYNKLLIQNVNMYFFLH